MNWIVFTFVFHPLTFIPSPLLVRMARKRTASNPSTASATKKAKQEFIKSPRKKTLPSAAATKTNTTIICLGYAKELGCEIYLMTRGSGDAYYQGVVKYMKGEFPGQSHELFDECDFFKVCTRRMPRSSNETMTNGGYRRVVLIRFPEGGSTTETRQQGMEALKSFLMDSRFSQYPPREIETSDQTDESKPPSLDDYFTDEDIKLLMEQLFNEELLTSDFADVFPTFAKHCWAGKNVSDWARSIGFPVASSFSLLDSSDEEDDDN